MLAHIHFAEIGLKGKNIKYFKNKLIENIKSSANKNKCLIKNIVDKHMKIIVDFDSEKKLITKTLKPVFGIKYFMFVKETKKDIKSLLNHIKKIILSNNLLSLSPQTKREDKSFAYTSIEINKEIGQLANANNIKIDYTNGQKIYIQISKSFIYLSLEKIYCYGGLPVGSSGKVLVLLSGGIDSPVATWNILKRGCKADFIHFYNHIGDIRNSKIIDIVKILNRYQDQSKIYFVPYIIYDTFLMGNIPSHYNLVFFKYFLIKYAEYIGLKKNYHAIITGDNLGQVASQTIYNLKAASYSIKIPILRPLITYEKEEIINISKEIDTFALSIKPYKDCCSLVNKNPLTTTNYTNFIKILQNIDINTLIQDCLKEQTIIKV